MSKYDVRSYTTDYANMLLTNVILVCVLCSGVLQILPLLFL